MVRVIDVNITVTQVSTQCPYPMVKVIDVSISHPRQYTISLPNKSLRRKYYSHPSQYTMSLPNKSHRRKYYSHTGQYTMSLPNKSHRRK